MAAWFQNLFGKPGEDPYPELPLGVDRFLPGGAPKGFRVQRTLSANDPATGREIFRSGSGVSLNSKEEAERFAEEAARKNLEAALRRTETGPASYAYAVQRALEPLVETLGAAGGSGELARITINGYGALVMNAMNALFVDVDTAGRDESETPDSARDARAANRLREMLASQPGLGFRVYRTRAGWRYLCTSRLFDPTSDETRDLLTALESDAKYILLCKAQKCFRARLTPKPWRTGQSALSPNNVSGLRRPDLERYLRKSSGYATAQFVSTAGAGAAVTPEMQALVDYHDRWTLAHSGKPLA